MILLIIAILASAILFPIGFVFGLIRYCFKGKNKRYFIHIAVAIDQLCNVICAPIFDIIMIKKDAYKFGNYDETISSVLGKNLNSGKLTIPGLIIAWMLGEDHLNESIEPNP